MARSLNLLIAKVSQLLHEQTLIQEQLSHDALTGLANRQLFRDRLQHAIALEARQVGYQFAIMFLDLDRFKAINDSFGHLQGDQLLIEVAKRLKTCVRSTDTIARLGGDEFAILIEAIYSPEDVSQTAQRIHQSLVEPFDLNGQKVRTTISIGIVVSNSEANDSESMIRNADIAMYRAKAVGRSVYVFFDDLMQEQVLSRLQLESDLRRAVEAIALPTSQESAQELYLVYQPIVDLETQTLVGFEPLLRWQKRDGTLVMPTELIAIAEEIGLILAIGEWVMRTACRQLAAWQEVFPHQNLLAISVNVSGKQLLQPDLVAQIQQILIETGITPACLKLELTETVLLEEVDIVTTNIRSLRAMGIKLAVDDFGTGYSSLSYLHRFNVNILKIERQFIHGIDTDNRKLVLVRAILSLAQNLGMEVVAEGVETIAQLSQLSRLGCRYGQGYLFSKPAIATEATKLLASTSDSSHPAGNRPPWF